MVKAKHHEKSTAFAERLINNKIECHKTPNHGKPFSSDREKISVFQFSEYLYSLRCINDMKNSGGDYLGY